MLFGRILVSLLVIITSGTAFTLEVGWSLVFVRAAIILEATDGLVDVAGRKLIELLVVAKDDDSDVDGAEDAQLVCLLEQAAFTLQEGDGAIPIVLDRTDLDLSATHC